MYDSAYHINDDLAELQPLFFGQAAEEVAVGVLQQLERDSQMVLLQHTFVIVHNGQLIICNAKIVTRRMNKLSMERCTFTAHPVQIS